MSVDRDRPRAATIFDVARLAGVSHQTVSRVLNDQPNVRPATRQRVEEAIRQLHYVPSQAARSLVTRRSRMVGVVTTGLPDFVPACLLHHIGELVRASMYDVLSVNVNDSSEAELRFGAELLIRQSVEAIILIAPTMGGADTLNPLDLGVPAISIGEGAHGQATILAGDNYRGARRAVSHLFELGHRDIRMISGPKSSPVAEARALGWRDQLEDLGILPSPPEHGDWSSESGYVAGQRMLADGVPHAVFAANDQMALGFLHAAAELGQRVPDDIGVVGFDDIPEAAHFQPPLTTLRQDNRGLSEDAVRTVISMIQDPETAVELPRRVPELVVRDSARRRG